MSKVHSWRGIVGSRAIARARPFNIRSDTAILHSPVQGRTTLVPVLGYQWANDWFAGVANGVGYIVSSLPQWPYGLCLVLDMGRTQSRSTALRGLRDIDAKAPATEPGSHRIGGWAWARG